MDTCCRIVPRAFCTFWLNETPWMTKPDRSTVTRSFGWNMSPPRVALAGSRDPWYTRPALDAGSPEVLNGCPRGPRGRQEVRAPLLPRVSHVRTVHTMRR